VSFWQPSLDDPRLLTSRHIVFNLSRPEKSLMLLAPLAKEAGGWGLCQKAGDAAHSTERGLQAASTYAPRKPQDKSAASGNSNVKRAEARAPTAVFASPTDAGYQTIHAMIVAGMEFLECDSTRFDMTHFKPRPDWVREMKRYGVLPECVRPDEVADVYAVEKDYWKSLWHQPPMVSTSLSVRGN
jgi:hypothetical protein